MRKIFLSAAIVAMLGAPVIVPAGGMKSIEDRTDIGWCYYVRGLGWICGSYYPD